MVVHSTRPTRNSFWQNIADNYSVDEETHVKRLIKDLNLNEIQQSKIQQAAIELVTNTRSHNPLKPFDSFLKEYDLSTEEGTTIMCIAEAILRIPDAKTGDALIEDKISAGNWRKHIGESESLFVNATTWAFLLTGKILNTNKNNHHDLEKTFNEILYHSSRPIIRQAVKQAIKIISDHFIISNNIENALDKILKQHKKTSFYSFDMLGEAAITEHDADQYFNKYLHAIKYIQSSIHNRSLYDAGVSIKLSALHPRYEYTQYDSVMHRLYPKLKNLALAAKHAEMNFVIDAEEVERLELQLDLFERLCLESELKDWQGLGLAVQTYQKRAYAVIDWLVELAQKSKRRIMLRLVKGAYWDTEIKRAQMLGLKDYPVFTRKEATDVSYLACAKKILKHTDALYPMFATHNAYSVAAILNFAGEKQDFEFQRLYGMGEQLYALLTSITANDFKCRVYAPCGEYQELLPYLVRRLLENGANTSFVNQILDHSIAAENVAINPIQKLNEHSSFRNPKIPIPKNIYQPYWQNSLGIELTQEAEWARLQKMLSENKNRIWHAASIVKGKPCSGVAKDVFSPANPNNKIATVAEVTTKQIDQAIECAQQAFPAWKATRVEHRVDCLLEIAELLETQRDDFIQLCIKEAGKTIGSAVAEIREAIDFCRYYAYQAKKLFAKPYNILNSTVQVEHQGHGVIVCISPWNFPLAIFVGQVIAALVTGNTVIAKPAEQTPIIAFKAVQLMHLAGIPKNVLQLIIGDGIIGAQIVNDARIAGVVFTGSTNVARKIRKALSKYHHCGAPLVAETGGLNAMLVDSSALLEQTVKDVIQSAFDSAGQRCSALRVVFVQQDIYDEFMRLLKGTTQELIIGDPVDMQTDIGPIIDQPAKQDLLNYEESISDIGTFIYKCNSSNLKQGNNYYSPSIYQIDSTEQIHQEAFGPILHVISYAAENVQAVLNDINNMKYGLTFGVQSRIQALTNKASKDIRAGNIYVNRTMIGATVGIQPFGGERLSGTGPKAGGPHYLMVLTKENRFEKKSIEQNTANTNDVAQHCEEVNPSQIESAINALEKHSHMFNFMHNELRIKYLDYMLDQLENNKDEFQTKTDLENAISVINEYKNVLNKNVKHTLFEIGPTGQRNELYLYNRGPMLYVHNARNTLTCYVSVLAANLVIGNPLLIISNNMYIDTSQYFYKLLIHNDLQEKYFFNLLVDNKTTLTKLLVDPSLYGFIILANTKNLTEMENTVANRSGLITPFFNLQDNRATGGVFSNPKNLYLISTERTISTNTTAMGGNTALYSLTE